MHHIRDPNLDDSGMHKASEYKKDTGTLLSDPNSMWSCLGKIAVKDQGGQKIAVI